ncbi:MAG: hypothetical protein HY290_04885, partial [Planctomycetia bacterium]|nr:hypothetical protein [Planctomycetia bacterium]
MTAQDPAGSKPAAGAPITEKEAAEFAAAIVGAAQKGDFEAFNTRVDWEGIIDKSTQVPNLPELQPARDGFKRGALMQLKRTGGMVASLHTAIKQGATYRSLRVNVAEKVPFVLFRFKLPNRGGVNYQQMPLARKPGAGIVATDIYVYLGAENLSDTFHRAWLPLASQTLKNNAKAADKAVEPLVANLEGLTNLANLVAQQKYPEALEAYRKLPESLRQDKTVLLLRLQAAQKISDDEYAACIEDFRKFRPGDTALDFILIDGYTFQKDYEKALQCVDRTNERVGGDAALVVLRGTLLLAMNRVADADKAIKQAIAAEPDLADSYVVGLDVALAAKNFDDTAKYLDMLEKNYSYEWKDLREVPIFADFVKSPQYAKWAQIR